MSATSRIRTVLDSSATVAVIAASIAVIWSVISTRHSVARVSSPTIADSRNVENIDGQGLTMRLTEVSDKGSKTRVAMVEFSDFECPFCGQYARETLPQLRREFVETGKLEYVFMSFPLDGLHVNARGAALASLCAREEGRFWEMHDWLFRNQRSLTPSDIFGRVEILSIDRERFRTCVGKMAERVDREMAEGRRLGVRATPTFLVGTIDPAGLITFKQRINGAAPFEQVRAALSAIIEKVAAGQM